MKKYVCYPAQMALAACSELILFLVTVLYLATANSAGAVIFATLMLAYGWLNQSAFYIVTLDESGVTQSLLWIKRKNYAWSEIQEAGVVYADIVKRLGKEKRPSRLSIYFSPKRMDSQERLSKCLCWPPKDVIGMRYQAQRLQSALHWWNQKLTLFNITALELLGKGSSGFALTVEEIRY